MTRPAWSPVAAAVALMAATLLAGPGPGHDPLVFFEPTVVLTSAERTRLDAGEPVVKTIAAKGRDLAIFSATRVDVSGDRLVAWARRVVDLKKGRYVPEIGEFSRPPRLDDVRTLTLDAGDLESLRGCRSGDCDLKLSETEIALMRRTVAQAGDEWRAAAQDAFRAIVVDRATRYLAQGHQGAAPYHDHDAPVFLHEEFNGLLEQFRFLSRRMAPLAEHLRSFPRSPAAASFESFLYWSKETLGGKAMVSVTHVTIAQPDDPALPEGLVAAKQVFATHYMTGSLGVTAIVDGTSPHQYLVYLNRSRIDVLDGLFGGFVRRIVERRLRGEAVDVIHGLRRRLEGGEPAASPRSTDPAADQPSVDAE